MCNRSCIEFAASWLRAEEVRGRDVLEVGARDVNGSVRVDVERLSPHSYLGVDIVLGPGVDRLCDVLDLARTFDSIRFAVVIATELLEHVEDWRGAISNIKTVLAPGGSIVLTTRSSGFPRHDWPADFWRFSVLDMATIFADFSIQIIQRDPTDPGVFVKATKPILWTPVSLDHYHVERVSADQ